MRRLWRKLPFRFRRRVAELRVEANQRRIDRRHEHDTERRTAEALQRLRTEKHLLLNVGASGHHIPGWISLDVKPDERGIRLDAAKPWPLPDECATAVRSEHMIEHLGYEDARTYLSEAFRVLEPGGVCRTVTPDLEAIARAYLEGDPPMLEAHRGHGYDAPTWSHFVNNYIRLWGHRHIFDFAGLSELLGECGFEQIERTRFGESRHSILAGTDTHDMGKLEGLLLCLDAVKPGAAR